MTASGSAEHVGDAKARLAHEGPEGNGIDQQNVENVGNQVWVRATVEARENARDSDRDNRVVLVDDLAAADDYWLTITDAARVTRRQEITIRRWISAGDLPVRRQRMGLNKRTRHVRASDLARLTPIIDPTATITGAPANADLLSIPVQQAQLLTAQHTLAQRLEQCDNALTDLAAQHDTHRQLLARQEEQLRATAEATASIRYDPQAGMHTIRQETQKKVTALTALITTQVQGFEHTLHMQEEATSLALHDIADQFAQEKAAREDSHDKLASAMTTQLAAIRQLELVAQQLQAQQVHVEQERRDWQQHYARIAGQQEQIQQHLEVVAAQLRDQHTMIKTLHDHLSAVRQEQQEWQRHLSLVQDGAATLHADLLVESQRWRMLKQQIQSRALRELRRRVRRAYAHALAEEATEDR